MYHGLSVVFFMEIITDSVISNCLLQLLQANSLCFLNPIYHQMCIPLCIVITHLIMWLRHM